MTDVLKTILVTRHIPLNQVSEAINPRNILGTIELVFSSLRDQFQIKKPRIAVCGLNPHAGEGGLFGDEELKIIAPVVTELKKEIPGLSGPYPPDTLFYRACYGKGLSGGRSGQAAERHPPDFSEPSGFASGERIDAVIALYHDQGLIPVKLLDFHGAVNVTLGLPIIRTSPDHGTADDIAGQGIANPASMIAAIRLAVSMAEQIHD